MDLRLVPPTTASEWDAYHAIREAALWRERGLADAYDRDHPDERAEGNHPLLLVDGGQPVGVVRVDLDGTGACLRRVAIAAELRGKGHGRALLSLAEDFCRGHGVVDIRSNVDPGAVGFYRKAGYTPSAPPRPDGGIPMQKRI